MKNMVEGKARVVEIIEACNGGEKAERNKYTFAWDPEAANKAYMAMRADGFEVSSFEKGAGATISKTCENGDVVNVAFFRVDHGTYATFEAKLWITNVPITADEFWRA